MYIILREPSDHSRWAVCEEKLHQLKLAKLKCECSKLDNGLDDVEGAIKTLKSVLGSEHALVGASCSLVVSAYEKRVAI